MTIKNIFILSRAEAERFDPETLAVQPAALVSITEPHEVLPVFVHERKYEFVFRYQFHDVTANTAWNMSGDKYKAMSQVQADDLADMLRKFEALFETLVVHCGAGISRSSAIALAVAEWKGLSHIVQEIVSSMHYFPNGHVLSLMRKALGTGKESMSRKATEEMYNKLFADRLNPWNLEEK